MTTTTFVNATTLTDADWFNDLDRLHYDIFSDPADIAAVKTALHAAPGAIGGTTPAAGAFTTLSATGGILQKGATAGLGYGTGAGGTVAQGTNRTTAVTLDKPCGAITMFSAAGSSTPAQFSVNNARVEATDVVVLSYKSSSNVYAFYVSSVGSGVFNISFWAESGVATDQPVINFAVIKAATS